MASIAQKADMDVLLKRWKKKNAAGTTEPQWIKFLLEVAGALENATEEFYIKHPSDDRRPSDFSSFLCSILRV